MKNILLILTITIMPFLSIAQEIASVEKSTTGIQIGFLGIWVHNEFKITNQIAFRSEIGFDSGLFGGSRYEKGLGVIFTPVITLEPRLYYNLNKRSSRNKDISGNSGNFLSLKSSYNPGWFSISNYEGVSVSSQVSIVPTWGIRRMIGNHFNYEAGIGLGVSHFFKRNISYENKNEPAINLHLRLGYKF